MRTILPIYVLALCAAVPASGQAIRFDSISTTTSAQCVSGKQCPLLVLPGTQVNFCQGTPSTLSACLASPATTYTSAAASTPCATTAQLTPATGGACLSTADAQGGYGAWFLPGSYGYYLRVPVTAGGGTYGPYALSIHGDSGGYTLDSLYSTLAQACTAAGTGTLGITRAWNATPSQTLACSVWFLGDGKIQTASSAAIVFGSGFTCPSTQRCLDSSTNSGGSFAWTKIPTFVYPQWWGAKGDGSNDDTVPSQAAITTGGSVMFQGVSAYYKLTAPLTLAAVKQNMYGTGHASKIVQTGANANANVFMVSSLGHNEFHDLYIIPGTTTNNTLYGWPILVNTSDYVKIVDVEVSDHRRGAFIFTGGSSYGLVDRANIHDSVVIDDPVTPDTASTSGNDFYVYGSGSYNSMQNSKIHHGAGFGCGFQTSGTGTDVNLHNSCIGNEIDGEGLYCGYAYKAGAADVIMYPVFIGNTCANISGNIPQADGQHAYGTGYYNQTAEHALIANNVFRNVNVYQPTVLLQSPGCVGSSGTTDISILGNKCSGAGSYQYSIIRAEVSTVPGCALFEGNTVESSVSTGGAGLYAFDVPCLKVTNNHLSRSTVGSIGVFDFQLVNDQTDSHIITGNDVTGFGVGIQQQNAAGTIKKSIITGNTITGNTGYGILSAGAESVVTGNTVNQGTGGQGIGFAAAVVVGKMTGNIIRGGTTCIVNDSVTIPFFEDNNDTGVPGAGTSCVTPYSSGDFRFSLTGATPTVGAGKWFKAGDFTSKTDFVGAHPGQLICLDSTVPNGTVTTSGTAVTWAAGSLFVAGASWVGQAITINAVAYVVSAVADTTHLTLTATAGVQASPVSYSMQFITTNNSKILNTANINLNMLANHNSCYQFKSSSWAQVSDSPNR